MALDLLTAHDAGEALSPPERVLLLARLADGTEPPVLEPMGVTTSRLLALYEDLSGPELEGTAVCPACAAIVEFSVEVASLRALERDIVRAPAPLPHQGEELSWRPIAYSDLVAASTSPEGVTEAVAEILSRCVAAPVPDGARAPLSEAMAAADPLAEIQLDLICPECTGQVRAELDVGAFTWAKVSSGADRLLFEIDALARAYSWSQGDILALSPSRRRRFVALVTGEA